MSCGPRHCASVPAGLFCACLLFALCGCYLPNPILEIRIAPDGRRAAILREDGTLGITPLDRDGALVVQARHAQRGVAWSPDSARLAWVEQDRNEPATLCVSRAADGNSSGGLRTSLLTDIDAKRDPVWLTTHTLAWLSDREGDDMNLWRADVTMSPLVPEKIADYTSNFNALLPGPWAGTLIVKTIFDEKPELALWPRPDARAGVMRITNDGDQPAEESLLTFTPDGQYAAWISPTPREPKVVLARVEPAPFALKTIGEYPLTAAVDGLALLPHKGSPPHVAIASERELLIWDVEPSLWHGAVHRERVDGLPLGPIAAWNARGLLAAVNQNLLLIARDARNLDGGELNAPRDADWLAMAKALHEAGAERRARGLLSNVWKHTPDVQVRFAAGAARARIERQRRSPSAALRWIERAGQVEGVPQQWKLQAAQERIALLAFERNDLPAAAGAAQAIAPLDDFLKWIRDLAETTHTAERAAWLNAGRELRQGAYAPAALALARAFNNDAFTSLSLHGLDHLLNGTFEPLGHGDGADQQYLEGMLRQAPYQRVLWQASQWYGAHPDQDRAWQAVNLLGLLLQQWASEGDLGSARELLRRDLSRPRGPLLGYAEICRYFLVAEENNPWIRRLVNQVLFEPEFVPLLEKHLATPDDALVLKLARAKQALLAGQPRDAERLILQARVLLGGAPTTPTLAAARATTHSALNALTSTTAGAALAKPSAQLDYVLDLFTAKSAEQAGRFPVARAAYGGCLTRMEAEPANWDANGFEILKQLTLLEAGAGDEDDLASYLRVQRGMGHLLLSPTRDPATLQTAINNLQTLLRFSPPAWLRPHLLGSIGICYSMRGENALALNYLRQAEALDPPEGLLQRLLLERAAVCDALRQSALAARLYGRIAGMTHLPAPLRASALLAQVQSEQDAGLAEDLSDRLETLLAAQALPAAWLGWLRLQAGSEGMD